MKNKKFLVIIATVLMACLVVGMGAMTYSRYISTTELPAQSATAAKWGYVITADASNLFGSDYKVAEGTTQLDNTKTPDYFASIVYVDDRAPIEEESDFDATIAGDVITCIGKVDATVSNYGVEFTAESTVEGARAQKYYGAMPGDTVKDYNGSTTFTFGDWDGTFEIILEGVHAGTKTLNFFANDTIIADTTFTVVVE